MPSRYSDCLIFRGVSEVAIEDLQNYARLRLLTCIVQELYTFQCELLADFSRKIGEHFTFLCFLFDKNPLFWLFRIHFFGKLIKKTSENILDKFVGYKSMRLNLLFRKEKTTPLYLVSIKSYLKNTQGSSILKQTIVFCMSLKVHGKYSSFYTSNARRYNSLDPRLKLM